MSIAFCKRIASDAWATVRTIADVSIRASQVTWRESLRIFGRSTPRAILEMLVGLCVLGFVAMGILVVLYLLVLVRGR